METNWYVYREQQRWGPYTWPQLREMVQAGQIQPADQLWHAQSPTKVRADQMQGLSELFKARSLAGQAEEQAPAVVADAMVTTALELPGYRITRSLGIVQAFAVPALNYGTSLSAAFSGVKGALTGPSQQAIVEAYRGALQSAARLGANAVVGFRFNTDQAGFQAYGTAVWVEPDAGDGSNK